jgi:DNA invertase Pin-like site-specific DNA recombinase
MFCIYVRVSEVGDREGESFGSPAEQEAAAREWAERHRVEVEPEPVIELDVSGAKAADDRALGRLIERVERSELEGIIVRYEDRFARDMIEGCLALRRIRDAGGRLVASASGFDSANLDASPDKVTWFHIQMAFAENIRTKNKLARVRGSQRAAERGLHLANRAPIGYRWADRQKGGRRPSEGGGVGRIEPDPVMAPKVKDAFKRRAEGESFESLAKMLGLSSKTSARAMIRNRVYLGEATVPTARKGESQVIKKAHPPLVTEEQWERANAAGGTYKPRTGEWADQARAGGLVYCSACKRRLSVGRAGRPGSTFPSYQCTAEGCPGPRVGVRMDRMDDFVTALLMHAITTEVPEVVAVLAGDDRYQRALDAVETARAELDAFVETVSVTDIGKGAWVKGKIARQAALDLARETLRTTPAPTAVSKKRGKLMTFEQALPGIERESNARFIDRIVVKPVGRGKRVPIGERVDIWFVGAEEAYDLTAFNAPAVDLSTLADVAAG